MKKVKLFFGYLTLFLSMSLFVPISVRANVLPMYATSQEKAQILFMLIFYYAVIPFLIYPLFNWLVEGFVAKLLLMKKIPIKKGFMKSFFEINIMTYYPAAILLLWINIVVLGIINSSTLYPKFLYSLFGEKTSTVCNLVFVEILVVIAEYFLIGSRLKKLYPELLNNKNVISKQYIFLVSLVANTCSVVFGLLIINLFK